MTQNTKHCSNMSFRIIMISFHACSKHTKINSLFKRLWSSTFMLLEKTKNTYSFNWKDMLTCHFQNNLMHSGTYIMSDVALIKLSDTHCHQSHRRGGGAWSLYKWYPYHSQNTSAIGNERRIGYVLRYISHCDKNRVLSTPSSVFPSIERVAIMGVSLAQTV